MQDGFAGQRRGFGVETGPLKIRWKLFLVLVLVVAGGTVGSLLVAEREFRDWVGIQVRENFERQVDGILQVRTKRLEKEFSRARRLAEHEVVRRALDDGVGEVPPQDRSAMKLAWAEELAKERSEDRADVARQGRPEGPRGNRVEGRTLPSPLLPLMGVVNEQGDVVLISSHRLLLNQRRRRSTGSWARPEQHLKGLEDDPKEVVGYGLLDGRISNARVKEVVVTPVEINGKWGGWFFLGQDAISEEETTLSRIGTRDSWTGIFVEGEWFADRVDEALRSHVEKMLATDVPLDALPKEFEWRGSPYLLVTRELNPESPLGQGVQVGVFDQTRLGEAVGELRQGVLILGLVALLITVAIAWWLSRRFSDPILRLVEATRKVREGDLEWEVPVKGKDEFAVLAGDFNRMTHDLSLKEKYRDLLGKTSDPSVAERLMGGSLELGGEVRQAAVVFCDIRGFTAMTDGMAPAEVIAMLNHHMTAMTRVIHEHGGVVDKFVGDMVMAVFGAPVARQDDVLRAARCALEMVRLRGEMNEQVIPPVEIGIGLSAGELVSGLMGSEDRLNYTVLGDRVNLAARLCSRAGVGEVLVDGETAGWLPEELRGAPHGCVEVRGFRSAVEIWSLGGTT